MAVRSQIHIFFGAPIIPAQLKMSEEGSSSLSTTKTGKELHFLCDEPCKSTDHVEPKTLGPAVLTLQSKDHFPVKFEQRRFELGDGCMLTCVSEVGSMVHNNEPKKKDSLSSYGYEIPRDGDAGKIANQVAYQQIPNTFMKTSDGQHRKPSTYTEEVDARHLEHNSYNIPDLVSSTKQISIHLKSEIQDDVPSDHHHSVHHEFLSQYLEMCVPKTTEESKAIRTPNDRSSLGISTDTEFLSIITSSQVAVLAQKHSKEQNETQKESTKLKGGEPEETRREREAAVGLPFQLKGYGAWYGNISETNQNQESTNSLELFSSEGSGKASCSTSLRREASTCENIDVSEELFSAPDEQLHNEIYIEPLSTGTLYSQTVNSPKGSFKRVQESEDVLGSSNSVLTKQQKSKRAKLTCSPVSPSVKTEQQDVSTFGKLQKHSVLLKNCSCKLQKYTVLVAVVHPCHIKEIQTKSLPKSSSGIPIATIVVIDQSGIERKTVLWRTAAFWSLTVFPGDIILLTDITVYEDLWFGETMMQSTFTSQLLNMGSCSAIHPEECETEIYTHKSQEMFLFIFVFCLLDFKSE
uniref:Shieldin complex subunit 2 first OB fold domain-containing protein n=1 Tax=Sphenodon punctatus TaxID=8508 RepID=A0A8D0GFL4_SPHPU